MKKIWQKDKSLTDQLVNQFTVGKDLDFDDGWRNMMFWVPSHIVKCWQK
ncbi:hypothetical protein RCH13_000159 [Chryseobacterium sp. MP_3.2]|nr:hypothetical protein [Chryseobacterium sp. MP_3.2]